VNARLELGDLVAERRVGIALGVVACGERIAEVAFGGQRHAVVVEILRLGHAAVGVLELRACLRVLLRKQELLAFFVQPRRDLGLALCVRDAPEQGGREQKPQG
jgi:hypothetical protein